MLDGGSKTRHGIAAHGRLRAYQIVGIIALVVLIVALVAREARINAKHDAVGAFVQCMEDTGRANDRAILIFRSQLETCRKLVTE